MTRKHGSGIVFFHLFLQVAARSYSCQHPFLFFLALFGGLAAGRGKVGEVGPICGIFVTVGAAPASEVFAMGVLEADNNARDDSQGTSASKLRLYDLHISPQHGASSARLPGTLSDILSPQ